MSELLVFYPYIKRTKKYNFSQIFMSKLLIRSFIMSNLSKLLTSLICHEQPKHLLTVALLT